MSEIFQVIESSVNVKNYTVLHDEPEPQSRRLQPRAEAGSRAHEAGGFCFDAR